MPAFQLPSSHKEAFKPIVVEAIDITVAFTRLKTAAGQVPAIAWECEIVTTSEQRFVVKSL